MNIQGYSPVPSFRSVAGAISKAISKWKTTSCGVLPTLTAHGLTLICGSEFGSLCGSKIFHSLAAVRLHHLRQWNSYQMLKADHLRQWDFGKFVLLLGLGGVGWGRVVGWYNNAHVPVHTQARQQAAVFHHHLLLGWGGVGWGGRGGVGWGGIITFMFQYTHTGMGTGSGLSSSVTAGVGWGGVGWYNNVHVPVHTQARQQAVVFHHQLLLGWGGVGWGGIITFMLQYTHRHGNRQWSFIISYCWGGVGWAGVGWD